MPALLQSVFKKMALVESKCASTGDDVMYISRSLNNSFKSVVQAVEKIDFL